MKRLFVNGAWHATPAVWAMVAACALVPARSTAQTAGSAQSPAATTDFSKPAFDTSTPLYETTNHADKASTIVVAEVDGRAITLGDVGDAIHQLPIALKQPSFESLYPAVLDQLVRQQALVVRAQRQGLDDDPVIRRRMKAAADQVLGQELMRREIGAGITETTLLNRYRDSVAGRPGPEEVRIRIILVGTEQEAVSILDELRGGGDFAAIARRASKDPTAPSGGDMGFAQRSGLNAEVGAVAFAVTPGQLVPNPVRSAGAWFVVHVGERRRAPPPSYPVARELLFQELLVQGIDGVVKAALAQAAVRTYAITGKEAEPEQR